MANKLLDKLKKNSTVSLTSVLTESSLFNSKDVIQTPIPALNIALSGQIEGGFVSGITTLAAPSKHFKSLFSLIMAKSYMDKYPDSIMLFYDSEFGTPEAYFNSLNIDMTRVLHTPILNVEELKFDITSQLDNIQKGEKVIIVIDSLGNLASKKEIDDALDGKSVADMSRAKQFKSLFRIITPHLIVKDIPCLVVNHTYKTMDLYSKDIVGGGTGSIYSSDTIFIIGRQQEKEGSDLSGYSFVINVEKSRYVKEKSKIPITVKFEGGVSKYSGLLDIALELGRVVKPSNGWYSRVDDDGVIEDKKWRAKDTNSADFWNILLNSDSFKEAIRKKFQVSANELMSDDILDTISEDVEELNV